MKQYSLLVALAFVLSHDLSMSNDSRQSKLRRRIVSLFNVRTGWCLDGYNGYCCSSYAFPGVVAAQSVPVLASNRNRSLTDHNETESSIAEHSIDGTIKHSDEVSDDYCHHEEVVQEVLHSSIICLHLHIKISSLIHPCSSR